jgi:hypothetical protein
MADLGEPVSYLVLEPGAHVYGCDGDKVGRVERVVAVDSEDIFDGLVVSTGMVGALGPERYVKAEQVEEIFERGVLLKLDAEAAKDLPAPGEGGTPKGR